MNGHGVVALRCWLPSLSESQYSPLHIAVKVVGSHYARLLESLQLLQLAERPIPQAWTARSCPRTDPRAWHSPRTKVADIVRRSIARPHSVRYRRGACKT